MNKSLCSTGYEYDAETAAAFAFTVASAKRALGAEIQKRGFLLDITFLNDPTRLHPEYAGELAAAELRLTGPQLANYRDWVVEEWADEFMRRQIRPLTSAAAD